MGPVTKGIASFIIRQPGSNSRHAFDIAYLACKLHLSLTKPVMMWPSLLTHSPQPEYSINLTLSGSQCYKRQLGLKAKPKYESLLTGWIDSREKSYRLRYTCNWLLLRQAPNSSVVEDESSEKVKLWDSILLRSKRILLFSFTFDQKILIYFFHFQMFVAPCRKQLYYLKWFQEEIENKHSQDSQSEQE